MKEIVGIIGVPTGMPTSGVIVYVWNIEDYNQQVALQFYVANSVCFVLKCSWRLRPFC